MRHSWSGTRARHLKPDRKIAVRGVITRHRSLSPVANPIQREHAASCFSKEAWGLAIRRALGRRGGVSVSFLDELKRRNVYLGDNPPVVFLPEMAYAYGRLGRSDDAQRLFALHRSSCQGARHRHRRVDARLSRHRRREECARAARGGGAKVRKHEADAGYLSLMNLKMNFLADPLVATPRFAEALARIRGD